MRGAKLPVALGLVFVLSSAVAGAGLLGTGPTSAAATTEAVALQTPVLSARRAPEELSRTVAHIRLRTDLDAAMDVGGRT